MAAEELWQSLSEEVMEAVVLEISLISARELQMMQMDPSFLDLVELSLRVELL